MCVYVCGSLSPHVSACISKWEETVGIPERLAEEHDNMATHELERSGFVFPEDRIMACHSSHGLTTYAR